MVRVAMTLEVEFSGSPAAVQIGGMRFRVETRFVVIAHDERGLPYDVLLRFDLRDRRFECTHLAAVPRDGGPPITLAGLRSIAVETLLRRAVQRYGRQIFISTETIAMRSELRAVAPGPVRLGGPLGLPLPDRRTGKRRGPDDDLGLTALVYEISDMCGLPPTQAVAAHLRVPLGTARDLVRRARERGLLGAAP
jgi:hypothetical protein